MDKYWKIFQIFVQEILNWLKLSIYFKFETIMLIRMAIFAQVSNMALVPLVFLYDKTATKFQCLLYNVYILAIWYKTVKSGK